MDFIFYVNSHNGRDLKGNADQAVKVDGEEIEVVNTFNFLRSLIMEEERSSHDFFLFSFLIIRPCELEIDTPKVLSFCFIVGYGLLFTLTPKT